MKRTSSAPKYVLRTASGSTTTIYGFRDDVLLHSENHYRLPDGSWSGGGPFWVRHRAFGPIVSTTGAFSRFGNVGPVHPWVGNADPAPAALWTTKQLEDQALIDKTNAWAFGATGWKRARPGNPVVSSLNFVRELTDVKRMVSPIWAGAKLLVRIQDVPRILYRRLMAFRLMGSQYLNVAFGWLPFISDLRKMYKLHRELDKHLGEIYRQNGKGIHRRRVLVEKESSTAPSTVGGTTNAFDGWQNPPPSGWYGPAGSFGGQVTSFVKTTEKVWFAGRFRYYIPDIGSSEWTTRATRALWGLNPTPEVIWNALPWSWLLDWFGNIGDMISNASSNAVDNLTADYAYVMRHWKQETHVAARAWAPEWRNELGHFQSKIDVSVSGVTNLTEYKTRVAASPFGFGVNFDSLSNYQAGVAAALGISRWAPQ
jgi:hypothetical protein